MMAAPSRLVLHPADPFEAPLARDGLLLALRTAGFIAAPLPALGQGCYQPGARFMQCLTFLGCAPVAEPGGPENEGDTRPNLYYVELSPDHNRPMTIHGDTLRAPRCPRCKSTWPEAIRRLQSAPFERVTCPSCGDERPLYEWNWRQQLAYGRQWISVWGVHHGEAVPADALLELLGQQSGREWRYAYCH
jgi:hypothetical protein